MNIDIIYNGYALYLEVKIKSFAFLNKNAYKNRNGVFVNCITSQVFNIKKNSIHIYIKEDDFNFLSEYLKFVFKDDSFGIKTENEILIEYLKKKDLNLLRM